MTAAVIWQPIVQVTCAVPWCRAVAYVPRDEVQVRALVHWQRVHPRRLRAVRARGGRR